jgi:hypothetical protein
MHIAVAMAKVQVRLRRISFSCSHIRRRPRGPRVCLAPECSRFRATGNGIPPHRQRRPPIRLDDEGLAPALMTGQPQPGKPASTALREATLPAKRARDGTC